MKAMLKRLSKENIENYAQIKRQNEHIGNLTKKLEKRSSKSSNKGSYNENSDKESNSREDSDEEPKAKKKRLIIEFDVYRGNQKFDN